MSVVHVPFALAAEGPLGNRCIGLLHRTQGSFGPVTSQAPGTALEREAYQDVAATTHGSFF